MHVYTPKIYKIRNITQCLLCIFTFLKVSVVLVCCFYYSSLLHLLFCDSAAKVLQMSKIWGWWLAFSYFCFPTLSLMLLPAQCATTSTSILWVVPCGGFQLLLKRLITEIPLSSRSVHFLTAVVQYVRLCYPGIPYYKPMTQMNVIVDGSLWNTGAVAP